jgi:hypothetical protein
MPLFGSWPTPRRLTIRIGSSIERGLSQERACGNSGTAYDARQIQIPSTFWGG